MRFPRAALLGCLAVLHVASFAWADDVPRELARRRYETGQLLYQAGRYAEALKEFEEARAAVGVAELSYNMALCLEKLRRPVEAAAQLDEYLKLRPDAPDAAEIRARADRLRVEAPVEPAPRRPRRIAALALSVVGGALVAAGAVTGGLVLSTKSDYNLGCPDAGAGLCDRARGLAVSTDVLLSIGAVTTVAGAVLWGLERRAATGGARAQAFTRDKVF